jgi:hypothetical protein
MRGMTDAIKIWRISPRRHLTGQDATVIASLTVLPWLCLFARLGVFFFGWAMGRSPFGGRLPLFFFNKQLTQFFYGSINQKAN